jgi:hypothetical protein
MAERPNEFVRSPDIDNVHRFAAVKPALEFGRLDPRERRAQPSDQSRE